MQYKSKKDRILFKKMFAHIKTCMICEREQELIIDHNHATGHIRGKLCKRCNVGIGHMRDSPELLIAASQYLIKYMQPYERPVKVRKTYKRRPTIKHDKFLAIRVLQEHNSIRAAARELARQEGCSDDAAFSYLRRLRHDAP